MATMTLSETKLETVSVETGQKSPNVVLKLRNPKTNKAVQWKEGTVDNENMNKKKSKCCCIYEKPRMFGESSSEDEDDDCEHCHGHRKSDPKHQSPDSKSQDASQS